MDGIWTFLLDGANRAVLAWIGGGIVIIVSGLWALIKFFHKAKKEGASYLHLSAIDHSVAARHISNSPITIGFSSDDVRQLLQMALAERAAKGEEQEKYDGIVKLGVAYAGSDIFWSREMRIFFLMDAAEKVNIIDAYTDHQFYRMNPNVWAADNNILKKEGHELDRLTVVPEGKILRFLRLDFPPLKGHEKLFGDNVLSRINAGETYTIPMNEGGKKLFWADDLSNPHLTALFSFKSPDGVLSVVSAVQGDYSGPAK